MSDSTNPNRQPTGVPVGGQFAANLHPEPALGLPGHLGGTPIATRAEWNAIPVGKHVLVQYTGEEGDGSGEATFVRDAETLRWDYGPYRMSGGANWDAVWDNQEGAVLLGARAANTRLAAHKAANLVRSEKSLREALENTDRRILPPGQDESLEAGMEHPPGRIRQALRRLWG